MKSAAVTDHSAASQKFSHMMTRGVRSTLNSRSGLQTGEQNSCEVINPSLATFMAVTQGLYFHMIEL
jgi:hypothetical protein